MVLTLNSVFTALGRPPSFGKHWATVEAKAISSASNRLNSTTAIRMKGRLTDMLQLQPGNFSFNREAINESAKIMRQCATCMGC